MEHRTARISGPDDCRGRALVSTRGSRVLLSGTSTHPSQEPRSFDSSARSFRRVWLAKIRILRSVGLQRARLTDSRPPRGLDSLIDRSRASPWSLSRRHEPDFSVYRRRQHRDRTNFSRLSSYYPSAARIALALASLCATGIDPPRSTPHALDVARHASLALPRRLRRACRTRGRRGLRAEVSSDPCSRAISRPLHSGRDVASTAGSSLARSPSRSGCGRACSAICATNRKAACG